MESFNFGRTYSRAFGLIRETIGSVGVFVLAFSVVSAVLNIVVRQQLVASIAASNANGPAPLAIFGSGWYWVSIGLGTALGAILYAGAMDGMIKTARGTHVTFADCLRGGFAKFLPALGLTILWLLGVMVGWILLLVPGLILMTMWSAALPALIGENVGVFGSFGRSRALTKGSRWTIFAVLLVGLIVMYAPVILIGTAIGLTGGLASGGIPGLGFYLFFIPYGWFIAIFLNSLLASIYLEAVQIKEGGSTGQLTEVFG